MAGSVLIRSWFNSHIHMQHLEGREDMLLERQSEREQRTVQTVVHTVQCPLTAGH